MLTLKSVPVYDQLKIEEALLRSDTENWCILNVGSPPAIVMGISGDPIELINQEHLSKYQIPIIRRYSGGGTVVIDEMTCFVSFIFNTGALKIQPFPRAILEWTEIFYKPLFPSDFCLMENDYVIGNRKCGGNAQYLTKNRWLHHSTFLWDYRTEYMNCLALPKKMPNYREKRSHQSFLYTLKDLLKTPNCLLNSVKSQLMNVFSLSESKMDYVSEILERPHRKSTHMIS